MSTYTIGDLVTVDERATFRNDVQLDNFDEPKLNLGLVNSYLFSSALPGRRESGASPAISPVGVLEQLVQAFTSDRLDNRFSLIATYGHGKSHLALALANYFSRAYGSPEVNSLLAKLANSLGDDARASRYDDFKQSRGEFLVVRLRGDIPRDLHTQFLQGLEKALSEHDATRGQRIPFWFSEAERIIGDFTLAEKEESTRYLAEQNFDLPSLEKALAKREDLFDLTTNLIHHVKGFRPHLGGEISLAEVVRWVTDSFCGRGKPLGGMLILFDEFSLYVQRYAQRSASGQLQDLLNGVSDRQGKAAFLAFSQLDLMQLADNLHIAGETKIGLKRELTRIPKKWVLFSLMESVVDAYLIQNEKRWEKFLSEPKMRGPIYQATDVAWERFKNRYSTILHWPFEQFQEHVTKGCFPLHPITTYFLCNLRLQSDDAGVPRTVLGFVLEALRARRDEPAAEENRPNWVLPIALVDYFEGRLGGDVYSQYLAARRTIGDDAPQEQHGVLKALLLQFQGEVTARRDEQIDFVAHAVGLEEKVAKQALRVLSDNKVIRYDPTFKVYTFWPASHQPEVLEETIQERLKKFEWSLDMLMDLDRTFHELLPKGFGAFDMKVNWGHPSDWAAKEEVWTADQLTPELLTLASLGFRFDHRRIVEGNRGLVLWVVATNDDEASSLREKLGKEFQTAFSENSQNPPAVVAVISSRPHPELLETYRRFWALQSFTTQERADVGEEMYDTELKLAKAALLRALYGIRGDERYPADIKRPRDAYIVPTAYLSELRMADSISLRELLGRLYHAAYQHAPGEFFTQYRVASQGVNRLREATRISSEALLRHAASDLKAVARTNPVVRDLCDKFLVQKWELLTADYRIRQESGNRRIREAWKHIDREIKPGGAEIKLRDVLFPLLNPPFGYDYNTALLVFAAWFGYHRLDLETSLNRRRVEHKELVDLLGKGSRDFFQAIAVGNILSLRRRTMPDLQDVVARIQNATDGMFRREEAQNEVVILRETGGDERYNVQIRSNAQQAAENLSAAIQLSADYDQQVNQVREQLARARTARDLLALQKKVGRLPTLANVQAQEAGPAQLAQEIEERFAAVIEAVCHENESPSQLTEVALRRRQLNEERAAIADAGLPGLVGRIDISLQRLQERELELKEAFNRDQRDNTLRAVIRSVDPNASLQQLYAGRTTLSELDNLTTKLEAERDKQLELVEQNIWRLEEKAKGAVNVLDKLRARGQLEDTRADLLHLRHQCAGTRFEEIAEKQLARAEALRGFFEVVEQQGRRFDSPDDVRAEANRLQQALSEFEAHLSDQHRQLVQRKLEQVRADANQQREMARHWLSKQEQTLQENGSLEQLSRTLANPPAILSFLSAEEQKRLVDLRKQIQQRIDEDLLTAIEHRFRQIDDRALQEECLRRLEALLVAEKQR